MNRNSEAVISSEDYWMLGILEEQKQRLTLHCLHVVQHWSGSDSEGASSVEEALNEPETDSPTIKRAYFNEHLGSIRSRALSAQLMKNSSYIFNKTSFKVHEDSTRPRFPASRT